MPSTGSNDVTELVATVVSIALNMASSMIHVCDYNAPITSLDFISSGMPCSSMYVNSTIQTNHIYTFNATFIESINEMKVIEGRQCYKLELYTGCVQNWFSANEIKRRFVAKDISRDECFSGDVCMNCDLFDHYPQEDCRVWTWGNLEKMNTKTFGYNVNVYQNALGQVSYGGMTTFDDVFIMGGVYNEKLFFKKVANKVPSTLQLILNPDTRSLISLEMRRLLQYSNKTVEYNNESWYLYDNNHLVNKKHVDDQLQKINAMKSGVNPNPLVKSSSADESYQQFQDYYQNAQLNVTNWYLNYLDCRIKKLAFGSYNALTRGLPGISRAELEGESLDLGPGEIVKDKMFIKHQCYRITTGSVLARNGCLAYSNQGIVSNLTTIGEAFKGPNCCKLLRLNQTHVIRPNSDDTISITEYSFPSLIEEEKILNYPPKVIDLTQHINEMIINSTTVNVARRTENLEKPVPQTASTPPFIDKLTNFSFFKWSGVFSVFFMYGVLIYALYELIKWLAHIYLSRRRAPVATDASEPSERNTRSSLEVKF